MNNVDVDADRVLNVKAQIVNDLTNIGRVRDVLKGQVITALEPYWQGRAKDLFTQQFTAFLTAFEAFTKACDELNEELGRAGKNYNAADDEVRRKVAGLPN
jgi:WXG100 family type VII secretion target